MSKKNRGVPAARPPVVSAASNSSSSNHESPTETMTVWSANYSGPIPPPALLEHFERILPGSANRIITLAENEAAQRHRLEQSLTECIVRDVQTNRSERARGQLFGLLIGFVTIVGGCVTAALGQPTPGGFIGTGGVIGLVAVFVLGNRTDPIVELKKTAGSTGSKR